MFSHMICFSELVITLNFSDAWFYFRNQLVKKRAGKTKEHAQSRNNWNIAFCSLLVLVIAWLRVQLTINLTIGNERAL